MLKKLYSLGRKIYRVKAKIPVAAAKLIEAMKDTEKLTEWNTTLTKHEILKVRAGSFFGTFCIGIIVETT